MTVQPGLCWTWLEPKLLVFPCTSSNYFHRDEGEEDDSDRLSIASDEAEFSDNDDFDGDFQYGDHQFMDEETKSRFTNYSMSSSVIRRNEGLTLLDDRFEKVSEVFQSRTRL